MAIPASLKMFNADNLIAFKIMSNKL